MDLDAQTLINCLVGLIAFVGGWIFTRLSKLKENEEKLTQRINDLAIALPEKYAMKDDVSKIIESLERRFDRLEEKIDDLNKKK